MEPAFEVTHRSGERARTGLLSTAHGACETPCFMPIATNGSLRAMTFQDAVACGTKVLMANAWHIYREKGPMVLEEAGGMHRLFDWRGIVFTDSGGYQVFSLRDTLQIGAEGVQFGAEAALSPEQVVRMQKLLGSDVMMVLDDCAPYPCTSARALEAVRRTSAWAIASMRTHHETPPAYGHRQSLWGIVQGGEHEELRRLSVAEVARLNFDGYALGGLSIGMPEGVIRRLTRLQCDLLPPERPRHLLGVGLPPQILDGIEDGVDTYDCVLPIRKGQRGHVYTSLGAMAYKKPQVGDKRDAAVDPNCRCSTCATHSAEDLRLLFKADKMGAGRLAAIHNLCFYHQVLHDARTAIRADRFADFKAEFLSRYVGATV